jgi:hypothetical protein
MNRIDRAKNRIDNRIIKALDKLTDFGHEQKHKAYDRRIDRFEREAQAIRDRRPVNFSLTEAGKSEVQKTLDIAMRPFVVDRDGIVTR